MNRRLTHSQALRLVWSETIFRPANAKPLSNKARKRLGRAKRQLRR